MKPLSTEQVVDRANAFADSAGQRALGVLIEIGAEAMATNDHDRGEKVNHLWRYLVKRGAA